MSEQLKPFDDLDQDAAHILVVAALEGEVSNQRMQERFPCIARVSRPCCADWWKKTCCPPRAAEAGNVVHDLEQHLTCRD
jgi:hypothetical protein